ncbi:MAG: hypothetical protein HY673_23415 [Chloroflexi bacterium]|nr:hypothetical protein [Chloroflexota bacterium]
MATKIKIRTFPSTKGDEQLSRDLATLSPAEVFTPGMPYKVMVDGTEVSTWDELLQRCRRYPEGEVEVYRFLPVAGGQGTQPAAPRGVAAGYPTSCEKNNETIK